jgi:signal transduction histidine kinase
MTNSFLGFIVFVRNSRSHLAQSFFGVTLATVAWSVSNYLADHATLLSWNDFFTRATFVSGILIGIGVLYFSYVFPGDGLSRKKFWNITILGVVLAALSASKLLVIGVAKRPGVVGVDIHTGPFYWVYTGSFLVVIILAVKNFIVKYRAANLLQKNQIKFVVLGVTVSALWGVMMNLILPAVSSSWTSSRFGPFAIVLFASSLAYAIARRRLFDIRLAIARVLTYSLLLATVFIFYAVIIFNVAGQLFNGEVADTSVGVKLYYIVTALFIAATYNPLKNFLAKVTRRIFFQDGYEIPEVIDELTTLLVGTIDLNRIVNESAKILHGAIRSQFIEIVLIDKGQEVTYRRTLGQQRQGDQAELLSKIISAHTSLLVADELGVEKARFGEILSQADVGLVARLQTSRETVGYILFGYKQTGSIFTNQDVKLIRTASDELAIAIQNGLRFQEIQSFNETLQQKVDDATYKLREANKKLRALDEVKDEFISMASHQLRTPLTSVKGYISMVLDGDGGSLKREQRKLLGEAFNSAQRMVYLISDFLNVSRIHTGKFVIERRPVILSELIQAEIDQLQAAAKAKGLILVYHAPTHFPALMLDEDKTRQVIMNFIDNAIYYTPSGGTITVELTAGAHEVMLKVRDTGIGVPKDERHHLFTKFFRASNARNMRPDGTGIGLFLAKKVVVSQGGALIFDSEVGKGSTFGFVFPRTRANQVNE